LVLGAHEALVRVQEIPRPMLLYRYFKSHAVDALRDSRLRVSKVSSFNDPFECMYAVTGTMTEEKAAEYITTRCSDPSFREEVMSVAYPNLIVPDSAKKQFLRDKHDVMVTALVDKFEELKKASMSERETIIDATLRVACFSADCAQPGDEILMWSHYSNSHRGVRIGFEMPEHTTRFQIIPMEYQNSRVEYDLSRNGFDVAIQDALRKSTRTKSDAWIYEQEHRLMTNMDLCIHGHLADGSEAEFISIDSNWVRRVDFGTRIDETEKQGILALVAQRYPHVECFQARYHATDYSLEYERCGLK
jgi:Protein of unknown function (DUF2971)